MKRSLRSWLWRVPIDQEVEEELAFHVEMRRREGRELSREEIVQVRRACLDIARKRDREMKLTQWLAETAADCRFAFRQLRAAPGFTAVAALTLALGIGANSAIFGLVDATLLRPLPFAESDRLFAVEQRSARFPGQLPVSFLTFQDLRARSRSFEGVEALLTGLGGGPLVSGPDGRAESAERQFVSSGFFDLLGVKPVAGRTFRASDEGPNPVVVMLSESLWRRRFGADPSLVGKTMRLNGAPFTLVGVVPDSSQFRRPARVWTLAPPAPPPQFNLRSFMVMEAVGRLKPGVTPEAARAEVAELGRRIAAEDPAAGAGFALETTPLREWLMGSDLQLTSYLLLCVVGFVLLMCCANVANLVLARGTVRARELALRTALGAGRGRVARQLLVENLVLAVLGVVLGLAIGAAILRTAPALIPPGWLPPAVQFGLDMRVALFGFGAAVGVGLLFGAVPIWQATRASLVSVLGSESRSATGTGRFRSVLAAGQVAAAVLLLCSAGLLLRTLLVLVSTDDGYRVESDRVLTVDFSVPFGPNTPRPTPEALMQFYDAVALDLQARPEIEAVGWSSSLPYGNTELGSWMTTIVGEPRPDTPLTADVAIATDGYFRTIDLPILAGRRFANADALNSTPVAIVNEAFVRRVLGGRNPIGTRITLQRTPQTPAMEKEIVGVARQTTGPAAAAVEFAQVYLPLSQYPTGDVFLVATASAAPGDALTPLIREIVARHEPNMPVRRERTLERLSIQSTAGFRFRALIVGTFAGLAQLLAMIGVFGVVAYSVQQRRREFGVRIVLGASAGSVLRLVLQSAGRMVMAGAAIGLALAVLAGRSMATFLYQVEPLDPTTFASVTAVLVLTAAAAAMAPAWRASRVDPATAFRAE
jgi:putative ABC transport system permease protein